METLLEFLVLVTNADCTNGTVGYLPLSRPGDITTLPIRRNKHNELDKMRGKKNIYNK